MPVISQHVRSFGRYLSFSKHLLLTKLQQFLLTQQKRYVHSLKQKNSEKKQFKKKLEQILFVKKIQYFCSNFASIINDTTQLTSKDVFIIGPQVLLVALCMLQRFFASVRGELTISYILCFSARLSPMFGGSMLSLQAWREVYP